MYRTRFLKFFVWLLTKLIPILRTISREPIIIKSNGLQLISSVIAIPIKGINNLNVKLLKLKYLRLKPNKKPPNELEALVKLLNKFPKKSISYFLLIME